MLPLDLEVLERVKQMKITVYSVKHFAFQHISVVYVGVKSS